MPYTPLHPLHSPASLTLLAPYPHPRPLLSCGGILRKRSCSSEEEDICLPNTPLPVILLPSPYPSLRPLYSSSSLTLLLTPYSPPRPLLSCGGILRKRSCSTEEEDICLPCTTLHPLHSPSSLTLLAPYPHPRPLLSCGGILRKRSCSSEEEDICLPNTPLPVILLPSPYPSLRPLYSSSSLTLLLTPYSPPRPLLSCGGILRKRSCSTEEEDIYLLA